MARATVLHLRCVEIAIPAVEAGDEPTVDRAVNRRKGIALRRTLHEGGIALFIGLSAA